MPGKTYNALYELASDHSGYFTTAQAREAGISAMAVVMMARRGVVQRVSHGVYRFQQHPLAPMAEYIESTLWPVDAEGIVSHESALALYGLSDVNPHQVHITLPAGYRVRRKVPASLVIHKANLQPADWHRVEGVAVTTPCRAIRESHAARLGSALIRQAIDDGRTEGLLTAREADRLVDDLLGGPHP